VNGYFDVSDISKNSIVGGRSSARVVLWLQTINRDHNIHFCERHPGGRDYSERACDDLSVHAATLDLWQQCIDLPETDKGITSH
jgi:hypothetical protein